MICQGPTNKEIPPLGSVVREVQRRHAQQRAHDVVALERQPDDGYLPHLPHHGVRRERVEGERGEVVHEFQVDEVEGEVVDASAIAEAETNTGPAPDGVAVDGPSRGRDAARRARDG